MCSPLILLTLAVLSFANTSITKIISADEYTIEADSEKHVIDLCSYKRCTFVKKVSTIHIFQLFFSSKTAKKGLKKKNNDIKLRYCGLS